VIVGFLNNFNQHKLMVRYHHHYDKIDNLSTKIERDLDGEWGKKTSVN